MISQEPGWIGMFTRAQAEGAIANGSRVVKTRSEPGDTHPVGSLGNVLGSLLADPDAPFGVRHIYFVEWDAHPRIAVGVIDTKIGPA